MRYEQALAKTREAAINGSTGGMSTGEAPCEQRGSVPKDATGMSVIAPYEIRGS